MHLRVGKKNICVLKMRNNYGAIQLFIYQYCDSNKGLFSIGLSKAITFLASFLYNFFAFFFTFLKAITIQKTVQKRSHELMKTSDTKNASDMLKVKIFATTKLLFNIGKMNKLTVYQNYFVFCGFSNFILSSVSLISTCQIPFNLREEVFMDLKESGTTSASEQPDNLVEIVGNYRYAYSRQKQG